MGHWDREVRKQRCATALHCNIRTQRDGTGAWANLEFLILNHNMFNFSATRFLNLRGTLYTAPSLPACDILQRSAAM